MAEPRQATLYFDYISPYAYLLWHRLQDLDPKQSSRLEITYRPILFAGLLDYWGQKGPAEIEAKRVHTFRQAYSLAWQRDIPFKMPDAHPFNPLSALRLTLAAGNTREAIDSIFRSIWVDGHQPEFCHPGGIRVRKAQQPNSESDLPLLNARTIKIIPKITLVK